jgi:hypothetical protein
VEKCNRAGEAKDNMAHAHFTLGISDYKLRVSEYSIVIEFLSEQWLNEHALTLRFSYIACLLFLLILHFHVADRKKKDCEPNGCTDPAVWSSYFFILLVG